MVSESSVYTCEICGAEFETPGGKGEHKRGHDVKVTREEVQTELRRLAEETGRTPSTKLMDEQGAYSANCVASKFDSWNDTLRSVGLTPNQREEITPADFKADIRNVAEQLGHPPTSAEQRELGAYCVTHAQNAFGGWNDALRAAGFDPHHEKGISDDVLLDGIHDLVETLGKVPTATEMYDHGRFSHRLYFHFQRWGGWQSAVRAAGYEPVGRPARPKHHNWKEQPVHEWREYGDNWDEQRQKALERDDYHLSNPGM